MAKEYTSLIVTTTLLKGLQLFYHIHELCFFFFCLIKLTSLDLSLLDEPVLSISMVGVLDAT